MSDLVGNPEDRFSHDEAHSIPDKVIYSKTVKSWAGIEMEQEVNSGERLFLGFSQYSIVDRKTKQLKRTFKQHHEKTCFLHIRKKKDVQLCGYPAADKRLCFRYIESKIPLPPKSEILSL